MANKSKKARRQQPKRKTTQTNIDVSSISPKKGPVYPYAHFIPFNGTKEEELMALRRLLPNDGSNPTESRII